MNIVKQFRAKSLAVLCAGISLAAASHAAVVTFNTAADLSSNFNIDVFADDWGTQWHAGYAANGIYAASNGGFVHFNGYTSPNTLQFKTGAVFLNGFTLSSQYSGSGLGVSEASTAGRDYTLELYDASNQLLSSQSLLVGAYGNWDFVTLDVAGVRSLRILATGGWAGSNGGWWPNIDNVTYNEPAPGNRLAVPEPGAISLVLAALGGLALTRRPRSAD